MCIVYSNHPLAFRTIAHAISSSPDSKNRVKAYNGSKFSFSNAKNEMLVLDTCSVDVRDVPLQAWHSEGGRTVALISPDVQAEELRMLCLGVIGIVKFTEDLSAPLQSAVQAVLRGELWAECGALFEYVRCTSRLLSHISSPNRLLTARENEIAQFLSQGCSNAQIAAVLAISQRTVKFHVSNLLKKCDAESRWEFLAESANKRLAVTEPLNGSAPASGAATVTLGPPRQPPQAISAGNF